MFKIRMATVYLWELIEVFKNAKKAEKTLKGIDLGVSMNSKHKGQFTLFD